MRKEYFNSGLGMLGLIVLSLTLILSANLWARNNSRLRNKVINEIARYYDNVDQMNITANDNGFVDIMGKVNTLYDKLNIFDIVSKIKGVKQISDDLDVKSDIIPDDEIRDNIINELHLVNSILDPDRIKVHVDNHIVFLKGVVSYYREKLMAETVASWQRGVEGIQNNIKVLPPKVARSDKNLSAVLNDILAREFPLDNNVKLSVENGVVTVSGTVSRLWDKKLMKNDFSKVLGVRNVLFNVKVQTEII